MLNYQSVNVGVCIYIYIHMPHFHLTHLATASLPVQASQAQMSPMGGQSVIRKGTWVHSAREAHMKNWFEVLTILKNMKVNGKDHPIYEMENKIHV